DLVSRRRLLTLAPLLTGAGFALWTLLPCYAAFAAGFVLWGAGSALRSGTLEALVYEELERAGATDTYARLMGRARALGTTGMMAATALAAPVFAVGGYGALGAASVAVCVLGALAGRALPETRAPRAAVGSGGDGGDGGSGEAEAAEPGPLATLREGLAQVRTERAVRGAVVLVAVVSGVLAIDEYIPLLLASLGAAGPAVPLFVLLADAGVAVGGWYAGRGGRWFGPVLAVAAVALAAGALGGAAGGGPVVAAPLVALACGLFQWALVTSEARLQDRVTSGARATVGSLAGLGAEVTSVLLFAGYAAGAGWWGLSPATLFAVAAVPYLALGAVLGVPGARGGVRGEGATTMSDSRQ
ncbi:MFS transporter, partial [Streptomyces daliensis]|nr:MFS transporter [Streptomyces daliensis]